MPFDHAPCSRKRLRGWLRIAGIAATLPSASPALADDGNAGARIEASYVADLLYNIDGGNSRGGGWLGRADLAATLDGEALGLPGLELHADLMAVHGGGFSDTRVGDAQAVSNIDAPDTVRPIEAWGRWSIDKRNAIKLGLIDLNSEFDVQEVGKHFINGSYGSGPDFSQSGENGPSIFPNTGTALVLSHTGLAVSARIGVFDARPGTSDHPDRVVVRLPGRHAALLVGEIDVRLSDNILLKVGAWHYTSRFSLIDPARSGRGRSEGAYVQVEGILTKAGGTPLRGWVRTGLASGAVNPISSYWSGGLLLDGERRRIGVAAAHARLGTAGRAQIAAGGTPPWRAETAIELNYAHDIDDAITLQPVVQYVIHPGWERHRRNALVAGMRVSLATTLD